MPSLKQNLVVVAMLASTASFSVWALPPQPATTVNYCQGGVINSTLSLHTNLSHYTYTSGLGCVVGANRLLNISGEPLQYTEPNNTAPVKVEFIGSRVESGGAITLRAPDFGFVNLMVPWVVDVKDNEFGTNAIVHFHGCMPLNSRLTISGNTFAGATAVNPRNPYFGIGAIALGVYDPQFTNPLHFRPGGEIVIADNIIKELRGTMGSEATGIMVVPASYFLADRTRMIVRNNSITAVGTDTAPIVPYNLKGYINVLPEYEGNEDIYFEFSNNHADVQKGMAWWLPGLWGPRGAQNLRANVTNNRATIDNVISTEKYACISSVVNCSKGASLNFERNEVTVKGSEGVMMFFEVLSEDSSVRIADNKFTVEGANNKARVTSQPFWGVKKIDMTGNRFVSADSEVIVQIGAINGTNMEGVVGHSRVEGMAALITFVDILMDGGKLAIEKMDVETRGNAATLNVQRTNLKGDAEARFREWSIISLASAVTASFSSQINVQDNAVFGVEANNFTAGVGDSIVNFANLKLKNSAVANIEGNRIWATRGNPYNLYAGGIEARDESALRFTFNNMRRTDSNLGMQNNYMQTIGDVNILDRAEIGVWNNSYSASNNTLFVGLFAVQGNTTVSDEANVHFCFNSYFGFSDPAIVLKVIPELLANLTDCEKLRWTPPTTTTAEPTTNATEVTSTTEQDGSAATTGAGATTSRVTVLPEVTTTIPGENSAARHLAGAVAVAFSVASLVFAAML